MDTPQRTISSLFDARTDAELFTVEDPAYLAPPDVPRQDHRWRRGNRRLHPKHYLEYLTDPHLDGDPRYDELTLGRAALEHLEWASMLTAAPTALQFARSLFTDLADMLGEPPRGCTLDDLDAGRCHPLTWPPPAISGPAQPLAVHAFHTPPSSCACGGWIASWCSFPNS